MTDVPPPDHPPAILDGEGPDTSRALATGAAAPDDAGGDDLAASTDAARDRLVARIEALLLAAEQPLSLDALLRLLAPDAAVAAVTLNRRELRLLLERLDQRLGASASAAELVEVASGWRLQVRAEHAEAVSRLWQEKPPRLSRALLETLALVVYRQPITRGEIEDVRGVAVSTQIVKTLLDRGWIREVGVKEVPGRPALFGTTPQLLDDLGLKTLEQLPDLPAVRDLDQLEAALERLSNGSVAALPVSEAEGSEASE